MSAERDQRIITAGQGIAAALRDLPVAERQAAVNVAQALLQADDFQALQSTGGAQTQ